MKINVMIKNYLRFKNTLLTLLLCLPAQLLFAQYRIEGTIHNKGSEALKSASVLLLTQKDSTLVKGTMTDEQGKFLFDNISPASYLLHLSALGFRTEIQELTISNNKDIGVNIMQVEAKALNEVVVRSVKPYFEQKLDRLIVNVRNSITAAGGSALDVLERSPGVLVNRGSNAFSLNGKEGVVIMINGKVVRQPLSVVMQYLSGLNANSIEKIELITNPPAKHEAAGNGGIINIVIAKGEDFGTNGSIAINAGYGQKEKAGANLSFNHRKNKLNLFGDFSYSRDHRYAIWLNSRTVATASETTKIESITYREPINTILNGRLGLDYELGKKTIIGAFVTGFTNIWDMKAQTDGYTSSSMANPSFVTVDFNERGRLKHIMGNLNVKHKLSSKTEINFDIDYLNYADKNKTIYNNLFKDENRNPIYGQVRQSNKFTPINIAVATLGITSTINKKIQIEYGIKTIVSKLDNDVKVMDQYNNQYVTVDSFTEVSKLDEKIGALFTSANFSPNEKTRFNVGLRYEYSETILNSQGRGKILDLTINKLFPTFFMSRKLSERITLQASYGKRITRPSFGDLAPFFIFLDPTTFSYGNTSLKPAFSNSFRLGLIYRNSFFALERSYNKNAIEGYQPVLIQGTNKQIYTTLNIDLIKTTSISAAIPLKIAPWWKMNVNILGVRNQLMTPQNESRSLSYARINVTKSFLLPKNYTLELSGFYQSPSLSGISRQESYQSVNLGFQKKFENNAKLRFAFNNIFGYNVKYVTTNADQSYKNVAAFYFEKRVFNLSYTFDFGNKKLKANRDRTTGAEEIKRRLK